MKKFQINRSSQELKPSTSLFTGCTQVDNPFGQEYVSDIFDTLEEAKAELAKYSTTVWEQGRYTLVEEYQIVTGEYDEDADCLMEDEEVAITEMPIQFTDDYKEVYSELDNLANEYLDEIESDIDTGNYKVEELVKASAFQKLNNGFDESQFKAELKRLSESEEE